jgi:hypothetical protein
MRLPVACRASSLRPVARPDIGTPVSGTCRLLPQKEGRVAAIARTLKPYFAEVSVFRN